MGEDLCSLCNDLRIYPFPGNAKVLRTLILITGKEELRLTDYTLLMDEKVNLKIKGVKT